MRGSRGRDNQGSFKVLSGMTPLSWLKLCQGRQDFMPPHPPIIGGDLSWERLVTLDEMGFCRGGNV